LDVVMGLEDQINYNLLDLLENRCRLQQALIRDKRFPNLYLIPAPLKVPKVVQYEDKFRSLIHQLKQEFDYCLIDCPAGIECGFYFAVSVADRAILLTTPHISAVKDAGRVLRILDSIGVPNIELIINEYDEKLAKKHYMLSKEDIAELFDVPILGTIPHDYKVVISQNNGLPVVSIRSKATKSFILLSKQMLDTGKEKEVKLHI